MDVWVSWTLAAAQFHFIATDHLGTPQFVVDATGGVSWKGLAEAFGMTREEGAGSIAMNLRFPGQYS